MSAHCIVSYYEDYDSRLEKLCACSLSVHDFRNIAIKKLSEIKHFSHMTCMYISKLNRRATHVINEPDISEKMTSLQILK